MKKRLITVAVLTLGATLAFAHPRGDRGHGGHGRHGRHQFAGRMAEKLNLTEAQKVQIAEIRKATKEQNAAFFENARQARKEMRAARKANDTAKVEAMRPLDAQREQMKQIRQAEMQKITAVFTPEQRTQFETMKAEREARRGDRKPRD